MKLHILRLKNFLHNYSGRGRCRMYKQICETSPRPRISIIRNLIFFPHNHILKGNDKSQIVKPHAHTLNMVGRSPGSFPKHLFSKDQTLIFSSKAVPECLNDRLSLPVPFTDFKHYYQL